MVLTRISHCYGDGTPHRARRAFGQGFPFLGIWAVASACRGTAREKRQERTEWQRVREREREGSVVRPAC